MFLSLLCFLFFFFFFFKQKTAYEMVSCDWSSDVCSSDLPASRVWLEASPFFKQFAHAIGVWVVRKEVRQENVISLLRFEEPAVAQSVAISLWNDNSGPTIPAEFLDDWKRVILDCEDQRHEPWLQGIFRKLPDVA